MTEVVDPRIAFAYVPIENVEVGLHAGFNSSGERVDAARLSNYVPLGLTLSAQTDNPVNRDSGAWVWEARGLVSLHPKVHKNWRLLIASGGSLGRRRHSFFSEELGKDAGADFTFASSSWDEELQITRSETRPEGAFDFSVSAFQQASLIFALQPYWVARAGTPNCRSVTGLGGEFSDFNMPWGAALTMTVLARVKP